MLMDRRNRRVKKGAPARRSPCPVACSLDIFGDRWTLLIVRDLFFGRTRFKDFTASAEGIPTNILTDRLERLLAHGITEQIPAEDGTKRLAYRLTQKGKALGPVLKAMRDWGLAWDKSTRAKFRMKASTLNSVTQLAPERRLR
jgi:DNA-binding HxlR family transcriptional regulator